MGVYAGPEITSDGLVLALDAGNSKGFDDDENLALNSEAINIWGSNGNSISISANSQIAPDGTLTADVLSQTAVTGASRWTSSTTRTYTAGVTYTLSIWLKKISGTDAQPSIGLWVEGGTNQSVGTITTEWVRYSKSFTPVSTISSNTFTGLNIGWDANGAANNFTFAAWGFQVETGSSASPYYATTSTAKIRGTTLIDMTGRGNSGTLTNGPTYSSANGGSIVFDGTNDHIGLPANNIAFGTGQFSIEAWVYASSFVTNSHIFSSQSSNQPGFINIGYNVTPYTGFLVADFNGSTRIITTNNTVVSLNTWYHVVGLRNSSNQYVVYVNGVASTTNNTSTTSLTATDPRIGINPASSAEIWNGRISNFRIYNRALTAAEISQNFNALRGRFGI